MPFHLLDAPDYGCRCARYTWTDRVMSRQSFMLFCFFPSPLCHFLHETRLFTRVCLQQFSRVAFQLLFSNYLLQWTEIFVFPFFTSTKLLVIYDCIFFVLTLIPILFGTLYSRFLYRVHFYQQLVFVFALTGSGKKHNDKWYLKLIL